VRAVWFQTVQGYSATFSGLQMLAFMMSLIIASMVAGGVMSKTGVACCCVRVRALCHARAGAVFTLCTRRYLPTAAVDRQCADAYRVRHACCVVIARVLTVAVTDTV
jgi:hypothetical protein